ncbi:alpha/beta-hydrolase [Exidia glandulosa HHB12029]|uniref:Alpha/beta-hydrolase n=1 Tax=Exidia glandulosa HHB12029 TaxID=1314781 RepID=A0A165L7G6_EXIGL|nr:alpha/beta-hydrolase [Exidia glandulosa HHB12029]
MLSRHLNARTEARPRYIIVGAVVAFSIVLLSTAYLYRDSRPGLWITRYTAADAGSDYALARVRIGSVVHQGREDNGVQFFGGMRYATPRRFAPAVPYVDIRELTVDAKRWGNMCMQRPTAKRPLEELSEDCLSLNVIRPSQAPVGQTLPVLVWIYGSGFQSGAPKMYDGTTIVRRSIQLATPIVFVSMDYRLGAWSRPHDLALDDQAIALKWIKENVHAFCGDANRTTLVGQSSGAMSIWHHVARATTPEDVWWRGVIAQSGAIDSFPFYQPSIREPYFRRFASAAGCKPTDALECLRKVENSHSLLEAYMDVMMAANDLVSNPNATGAEDLVDVGVYGKYPWMPNADSLVDGWETRLKTNMNGKNALVGVNLDEGYDMLTDEVRNEAAALSLLIRSLNSSTRALRLWDAHDESPRARAAQIIGDIIFQAPMRATARALGAYYYLYAHSRNQAPVTHGEELCALFRPDECGVGYVVQDRWISFVAHGHPGDEQWKPYPSALRLDAEPRAIPLWRVKQLQIAEDVVKEMRDEWAGR